ncbi:MAG: carboxypeptidase M32 [Bacteroidetes bacterium]|nr:carboxypeptidase M32 [Bacteroidota bacterium]
MRELADLRYANAVLQWDQETYMPEAGAERRSGQIATLSELAHRFFTDPQKAKELNQLLADNSLDEKQRKNVSLTAEDVSQQAKLPGDFVRTMSETVSKSFQAWMDARKANNFAVFAPLLGKLIDLKKKEADYLGWQAHPYNALLNQYEKGCTVSMLDATFAALRAPLSALLAKIAARQQVSESIVKQSFPEETQWQFSMDLLEKMGFDFRAGRQDKSTHPFTTNFSAHDVRITTRIDPNDLSNMTYSTIHELGHALYEQGLPDAEYGLPLGEFTSLGIHESQSRLWENNVGRSLSWCSSFFPLIAHYFPEQCAGANAETFYRAVNRVQPSFIRTEADELTYHFHVMIRYELEKTLMEGSLPVNDIPAYWHAAYKKYLGIEVPDDKTGCLQDVHWSHGSFGYFPTYSLGSLYAAQFFGAAEIAIPGLQKQLSAGNFGQLLNWLRQEIHIHGRFFTSEELCKRISGDTLNINWFMQYVKEKYRFIYSLEEEAIPS